MAGIESQVRNLCNIDNDDEGVIASSFSQIFVTDALQLLLSQEQYRSLRVQSQTKFWQCHFPGCTICKMWGLDHAVLGYAHALKDRSGKTPVVVKGRITNDR